jgi:hypothetical protein
MLGHAFLAVTLPAAARGGLLGIPRVTRDAEWLILVVG